jgi:hypothetical protein
VAPVPGVIGGAAAASSNRIAHDQEAAQELANQLHQLNLQQQQQQQQQHRPMTPPQQHRRATPPPQQTLEQQPARDRSYGVKLTHVPLTATEASIRATVFRILRHIPIASIKIEPPKDGFPTTAAYINFSSRNELTMAHQLLTLDASHGFQVKPLKL